MRRPHCGVRSLADAGIPMTDMVVSVASGKVNDVVVCDLNKEEDNYGKPICQWAYFPTLGNWFSFRWTAIYHQMNSNRLGITMWILQCRFTN